MAGAACEKRYPARPEGKKPVKALKKVQPKYRAKSRLLAGLIPAASHFKTQLQDSTHADQ